MATTPVQTLDDELHEVVRMASNPHQVARVHELLYLGANPNYRKKRAHTTIVEYVMSHCNAAIVWALLNPSVKVDFNERKDSVEGAPIVSLVERNPSQFSDVLCRLVYERTDKTALQTPHSARLLFCALRLRRISFAKMLIEERHAFDVKGYLHICALYVSDDIIELARTLIANGYRETGRVGTEVSYSDIEGETALSLCVRFSQFNRGMFDLLAPFAEVTWQTLRRLANQFKIDDIVTLTKRTPLRSLPDLVNVNPGLTTAAIIEAMCAHIQRKPAIPIAMSGTWRTPPEKRAKFVISLLQQGENLDVSMVGAVGLEEALLPLNGDRIQKFCSRAFRALTFCLLLGMDMGVGPDIPYEIKLKIVEHVPRDV